MREILFRGKRTDNDEWVYGDFVQSSGKMYIHPKNNTFQVSNELSKLAIMHKVIPETVGEYTGCDDDNGKKVFEGDILKARRHSGDVLCKVVFEAMWFIGKTKDKDTVDFQYCDAEVIGNVHDNPELWEKEKGEQ